MLDDTRAGHEVHFRIFRTDAAFDGVSPLLDVLLSQLQYLSVGYLNLFFYQIYADYFFCDGMFHLQAGVHFQKVIIAVLVHQEFNGSRADVVHGLGSSYCLFAHVPAQFRCDKNRRALFYDLLVAALHRAFTFAQVNYVAMLVAQYLELDVMGFFHKLLQIDRVVSERGKRFALGCCIGFGHFVCMMNQSHSFSATAHRGFQHYRIADLVAEFYCFLNTFQVVLSARNYRYPGFDHLDACRDFISHGFHCFRVRTDKGDAFFPATAGKGCIFR